MENLHYEKIATVTHIGSNLLIVGYNRRFQWAFRIVNKAGEIVREDAHYSTAILAEQEGTIWIKHNLLISSE
ncbi:MAG: hypothetical protein NZ901_08150 [Geminocystis sp.]|nr:hypothetical protein [Geminocystis sp.]HIK36960.1 hypothetical protein [Geminocystis sp. M7585_C2015_104]MCS7148144.1 hypothetical protein [Geminocystis sp.]MCX8078097.1 hypothetical protein [Geminocystis sp.]MDW8116495.1 hypothetical protein [Geminocystis sp.]